MKIENEVERWIYYIVLILIDIVILFSVSGKLSYWTMEEKDISFVKGKFGLNYKNIKEYFHKELEYYLKNKNLHDKIPTLINLLEKKSRKEKMPFVFSTSIFSTMSLIIFSSFCNKIYQVIGSHLYAIISITVILLLFSITIIYVALMVKDLNFRIFTDYISIKNLIDLLEEYQLLKEVKNDELKTLGINLKDGKDGTSYSLES